MKIKPKLHWTIVSFKATCDTFKHINLHWEMHFQYSLIYTVYNILLISTCIALNCSPSIYSFHAELQWFRLLRASRPQITHWPASKLLQLLWKHKNEETVSLGRHHSNFLANWPLTYICYFWLAEKTWGFTLSTHGRTATPKHLSGISSKVYFIMYYINYYNSF